MMQYVFVYLIIIGILTLFVKKKKIIVSNTGSEHQTFANVTVPLVGGIYMFIPILALYINDFPFLIIAYTFFFCLGFLSDINIIESPKKRFVLQLLILLIYTYISELEISSTRIDFFDVLLENLAFSYIFTIFCLIVFINGSNFIDGLNGLLITYILLIFFFLYKLDLLNELGLNRPKEFCIIFILIFLAVMNMFNQLFLGDNGSYSLSFIIGILLINVYNFNDHITPYFIIVLLWYPCFENLFSIIRKLISNKNPLEPDNGHLHYHLYSVIKKGFKLSKIYSNNFASILINIFNFVIFYVASLNIYHTSYQLSILTFSIIFYIIIYFILKKIVLN